MVIKYNSKMGSIKLACMFERYAVSARVPIYIYLYRLFTFVL
jgi:hypothetical protein